MICDHCGKTILDKHDSILLMDRLNCEKKNFHRECFAKAAKQTVFGTFTVHERMYHRSE